ncbi:hypothetical protein GCM10027612_68020 [Microbispora bryophytorum subsp. camponoti]
MEDLTPPDGGGVSDRGVPMAMGRVGPAGMEEPSGGVVFGGGSPRALPIELLL